MLSFFGYRAGSVLSRVDDLDVIRVEIGCIPCGQRSTSRMCDCRDLSVDLAYRQIHTPGSGGGIKSRSTSTVCFESFQRLADDPQVGQEGGDLRPGLRIAHHLQYYHRNILLIYMLTYNAIQKPHAKTVFAKRTHFHIFVGRIFEV